VQGEVMVSSKEWWWELECRQLRSTKQGIYKKNGQPLEDDGRREEQQYGNKRNKEGEAKNKLQKEERVEGENTKR
jgi:hypothetical protein